MIRPVNCYICGKPAKYLDPFHPWHSEKNRCDECNDVQETVKELRKSEISPRRRKSNVANMIITIFVAVILAFSILLFGA